jgi:hypothetical protein
MTIRRSRTLLPLVLFGCATASPPPAAPLQPAPLQPAPAAALPATAAFLADADAKLALFRTRTSWPSEGDHDSWKTNLQEAERLRGLLDAGDDPQTRRALETRLSMLSAADGVFRLGERMRERR